MRYKAFGSLKFNKRDVGLSSSWIQAKLFFDNGYGVSVILWPHTYWWDEWKYELAILKGKEDKRSICYTTPITDDVIWYLTHSWVSKIMKRVQMLKK